jgi:hypothetical protein
MVKIHTRRKRLMGITSLHRKHRYFFTNVTPKKGYKSFLTKEKAHAWAKEHSVDTAKLVLYELQQGKKFQWRPKPRE